MIKLKYKKISPFYPIWTIVFLVPLFISLLMIFDYSPNISFEIVILAAIVYMVMALLHHHSLKTLSFEIMVEYALVALLCLIVVLSQSFLF